MSSVFECCGHDVTGSSLADKVRGVMSCLRCREVLPKSEEYVTKKNASYGELVNGQFVVYELYLRLNKPYNYEKRGTGL